MVLGLGFALFLSLRRVVSIPICDERSDESELCSGGSGVAIYTEATSAAGDGSQELTCSGVVDLLP